MDYKQEILDLLDQEQYKPATMRELKKLLNIPKNFKNEFNNSIDDLIKEGKVFKSKSERFGIPGKMGIVSCILSVNERGFGFADPLIRTKKKIKIYISSDRMNGAMHGDSVMVKTSSSRSGAQSLEGQVLSIFKRAHKNVVGTFEMGSGFGFVIPDNQKIIGDIFIPFKFTKNAKSKDKVIVKIVSWPEERRDAEGEIIEILGRNDDPGVDILSIIRGYNIDVNFPSGVLNEAKNIKNEISNDEIRNRVDLRDLRTITIDGEDAKDLDDAISIKKNNDDTYDLYVHIADVTHYVKEGSELDNEARKRGTSVYLVDRTIPMLPPELSNVICSLNAGVDRLSFTCFMKIKKSGEVIEYSFKESLINIDRRFSYNEIFRFLQDPTNLKHSGITDFSEMLFDMYELSIILKKNRNERGTLEFDLDESKVVLGTDGKPIDIIRKKRNAAESIIEEFMIAANETVAQNFYHAQIPFIYRVHESPDKDKLRDLNKFLSVFGYKLRNINSCQPADLNAIILKAKGRKEEQAVNTVILRTQQKARYSEDNDGHFGLASKMYTHFTSPIRRYPDLYIHRMMKIYLMGQFNVNMVDKYEIFTKEVARTSSLMETRADEAERDSVQIKKVEYMQRHIGDTFSGIISSVQRFGFFVELENTVEGLVKVADLYDDYYIFDEIRYSLIGESTTKKYTIGDRVDIVVINADIERKQIDFILEIDKKYMRFRK